MKKIRLVSFAAVLAALLVISGCASSGGSSGDTWVRSAWRITKTEGGMAARGDQVTTRKGENFLYIYFPVVGCEFDSIKLDFTIDRPIDVYWQCAYIEGGVVGSEELIGTIDKGPIETDFTGFDKIWYSFDKIDGVVKPRVNGMCLKVNDPEGGATFTLTNVELIGLQGEAPW